MSGLIGSAGGGASIGAAKGVEDDGGGGGSGTLKNVTSADGSVIVTSPSADVRDLSENGVFQLIDSFGSGDDTGAINAALASLAGRAHSGGVLQMPAGTHRADGTINVPTGCSIIGAGKGATIIDNGRNAGACIKLLNAFASRLSDFSINASVARTAGAKAIDIVGGNASIQPFAPTFTLSANEIVVKRVDMDQQFDGVVIENDPGPPVKSTFLTYVKDGRYGRMQGGDGIRIDCAAPTDGNQYGASQFIDKVAIYAHAGDTLSNGLHIVGTGDATIEKVQTFNIQNGLNINTPTNGRCSTLRFARCQFDTSTQYCAWLQQATGAITDDICFEGCWFAGGGVHNVLVQSASASDLRFIGCKFFFATQYGIVLTGAAPGPLWVTLIGNTFSGAGSGGFRSVVGSGFTLIGNRFNASALGLPMSMPQAVTVDAGNSDFTIADNNWIGSVAGLLDNSGDVRKSVGGNLGP